MQWFAFGRRFARRAKRLPTTLLAPCPHPQPPQLWALSTPPRDIIARFGQDPSYRLPPTFFDDFITVAEDECRHFLLLEARLEETGSRYGALPAHDGLWESAWATGEAQGLGFRVSG